MLRSFLQPVGRRGVSLLSRVWASVTPEAPKYSEQQLTDLLKQRFPKAKDIQVADVSGGCGAMYEIHVESAEFRGLSTVKQHRLVTETLKEQIKEMHGLRINTIAATDS